MANAIVGGMSEDEIRDYLLRRGVQATQNTAGFMPLTTDAVGVEEFKKFDCDDHFGVFTINVYIPEKNYPFRMITWYTSDHTMTFDDIQY